MQHQINEIDKHTWMIKEFDDNNSVYCYLLEGEKEAALIDPGFGSIDLKSICASLTDKPITVILTHGHIDHIGGTGYFDKILLAKEDITLYQGHSDMEMRKKFSEEELCPVNPNVTLIKEKILDLGGRTLEIIPIPGHSRGCICILDKEARRLFTGDSCCKAHVLFQLDNAGRYEEFLAALENLWGRRDEFDITWPAHHAYPLEDEIIMQFIECTKLFLKDELPVTEHKGLLADYRLVEYKDVGIEF